MTRFCTDAGCGEDRPEGQKFVYQGAEAAETAASA